jgi:hypothetical protein
MNTKGVVEGEEDLVEVGGVVSAAVGVAVFVDGVATRCYFTSVCGKG